MTEPHRPARIISGGQTGVDRGALDAAIEQGIAHGGACPRGRRAEDGVIPYRYLLEETDSARYEVRTEKNVMDADATLLLSAGPLRGGSALTKGLARKHKKPLLHIDLDETAAADAVERIREFLREHRVGVLNVSGPRESGAPGISARTRDLLRRACR